MDLFIPHSFDFLCTCRQFELIFLLVAGSILSIMETQVQNLLIDPADFVILSSPCNKILFRQFLLRLSRVDWSI